MYQSPRFRSSAEPSFAQWSRYHGVTLDDGLLAIASVICAVAGSAPKLNFQMGGSEEVKAPSLVFSSDKRRLPKVMEFLLAEFRKQQGLIMRNGQQYQEKALKVALSGFHVDPTKEKPGKAVYSPQASSNVLDAHLNALISDEALKHMDSDKLETHTRHDLTPSIRAIRFEALTRALMLLEQCEPHRVLEMLSRCHGSHATVYARGAAWLKRARSRGKGQVWTDALDGMMIRIPGSKALGTMDSFENVRMHAFVEAPNEAIIAAGAEGSPLLDRALVLGLEEIGVPVPLEADMIMSASERIERAVANLFTQRRAQTVQGMSFNDLNNEMEFQQQIQQLTDEVELSGEAARLKAILMIPAMMAYTFQQLYPKQDVDEVVLVNAVPLARRQLERQLGFLHTCRERKERQEQQHLMEKLLNKLLVKQPIGRRGLMRCFDQQQADRFHRLIDALLQDGRITEEDRQLRVVTPRKQHLNLRDES